MPTPMLRYKLPPNMRSKLWIDFMDAIEEESGEAKLKILDKKYIYNIDSMSYERLLELANVLGIPFDVSVNDTEEFLREEVRSVPFRIKWKATLILYMSFFRAVDRKGIIFLYYWDGANLIRHSNGLLLNINGSDPSKPYIHTSIMNFTGVLSEETKLDAGLKLDSAGIAAWKLDNATSKQNTKHFAYEIIIDRYFYGPEQGLAPSKFLAPSQLLAPQPRIPYLMSPDYFQYLETNMNISKKVTEVPHIGCQLNAIMDNSRIYDSLGYEFTMPDLKLYALTTDNMTTVSTVDDIMYMEFGISRKTDLPYSGAAGVQPSQLTEKIAKITILPVEKYEDDNWYGVCAQYIGNLINDQVIAVGDGIESTFTYTLPYSPVKKGNVRVTFTSGLLDYIVDDDTFGKMVGTNASGTINYETGELVIETDIYYPQELIIGNGTGSETDFTFDLDAQYTPVLESSVFIKYIISGTTLVATDDGLGVITGSGCTGTINYTTGEVVLSYSTAPANTTDITMYFQSRRISIPDNGTNIAVEYYFTGESVELQEACVKNAAGQLLAYTMFPKIKFKDFFNHLNLSFIIKKTNF